MVSHHQIICILALCSPVLNTIDFPFNLVANKPLKKGRPSQPVRIVGFKTIPKAGDPIVIAASEEEAKELVRLRESEIFNEDRADFENDVELQVMGTAAKQGSMLQRAHDKYGFDSDEDDDDEIVIPVVIKADSHGALEAVRDALVSIGTDSKLNVVIDPVEMSTGVVTTSDVVMARGEREKAGDHLLYVDKFILTLLLPITIKQKVTLRFSVLARLVLQIKKQKALQRTTVSPFEVMILSTGY